MKIVWYQTNKWFALVGALIIAVGMVAGALLYDHRRTSFSTVSPPPKLTTRQEYLTPFSYLTPTELAAKKRHILLQDEDERYEWEVYHDEKYGFTLHHPSTINSSPYFFSSGEGIDFKTKIATPQGSVPSLRMRVLALPSDQQDLWIKKRSGIKEWSSIKKQYVSLRNIGEEKLGEYTWHHYAGDNADHQFTMLWYLKREGLVFEVSANLEEEEKSLPRRILATLQFPPSASRIRLIEQVNQQQRYQNDFYGFGMMLPGNVVPRETKGTVPGNILKLGGIGLSLTLSPNPHRLTSLAAWCSFYGQNCVTPQEEVEKLALGENDVFKVRWPNSDIPSYYVIFLEEYVFVISPDSTFDDQAFLNDAAIEAILSTFKLVDHSSWVGMVKDSSVQGIKIYRNDYHGFSLQFPNNYRVRISSGPVYESSHLFTISFVPEKEILSNFEIKVWEGLVRYTWGGRTDPAAVLYLRSQNKWVDAVLTSGGGFERARPLCLKSEPLGSQHIPSYHPFAYYRPDAPSQPTIAHPLSSRVVILPKIFIDIAAIGEDIFDTSQYENPQLMGILNSFILDDPSAVLEAACD